MDTHANAAGDLDAEELLHLALKAMEDERDAEAIGLLKRGLALDPEDGRLHYLLGALHAQIGMYERAIGELQRAVQLAPQIDMAHFQLGLLQLTSGDVDDARASWSALDPLDAEHPLSLFRAGMLALVEDDFDTCIDMLRRGIELNAEHDSLSRDMARVIETAEAARAERAQAEAAAPASADTTDAQHILLAGYRRPTTGDL
jgi:Flp pilus assembly protein TadD